MNQYNNEYWQDTQIGETVKTFHRFYHLARFLGFDPLFFSPLDSNLETSQRHHFLAVLFRKMSSFVTDHVLTTIKLHRTYDTLFTNLGLRQTQALIEGAMAAMEELIWLRDENGNFKDLTPTDFPLIQSILKKHLGSRSDAVWDFWTKGSGKNSRSINDFRSALSEFNTRRKFIMASDGKLIDKGFQDFLDDKFHQFYTDDLQDIANLNPELFLGTKADFRFMNIVFMGLHKFDLSNL